jgi:hypothetical protein
MSKLRRSLVEAVVTVDDIVEFIDMVARVWPTIANIKIAKRTASILEYFEEIGFIERKKAVSRGDAWAITDKCFKAIQGKRAPMKRDYKEAAKRCIVRLIRRCGSAGAPEEECCLFCVLEQILLHEEEALFMWIRAEIMVVVAGVKKLPQLEIGKKAGFLVIDFARKCVTVTEMLNFRHRYISRIDRDIMRKKKRRLRRRIAELNAIIGASPE